VAIDLKDDPDSVYLRYSFFLGSKAVAIDVLIIGGGMVGATLACALADTPLKVAVVESTLLAPFDSTKPSDLRVSALSQASEAILKNLGAWEGVISRRACPYARMKVWESNAQTSSTLFDARDLGFNELGHIVENSVIQIVLTERLKQADNIRFIAPAKVTNVEYAPGASLIELDTGESIVAHLLVAADGGDSEIRNQCGIGVHRWDYEQHAFVIGVETDYPQQDITWQQFTPSGPKAFLPLCDHHGSLVWYDHPSKINQLKQLDDQSLLDQITMCFPSELGAIRKVINHGSFPLRRQHAQQYYKEGVVLVGDSAHMINPLAGQGVNIGLLDAAVLAEEILNGLANNESIWRASLLKRYEHRRRNHNLVMMQTMDFFYRMFSNDNTPLKLLRNAGLKLAGRSGTLKNKVMAFAMGIPGAELPLADKIGLAPDLPAIAKGDM
jgi:2-octaprenyl-3-methyl-6-methoxy-1,4-benzoquinol hydroxylase